MKLVIGLAVIFVCIITYAFLDAAKKADKSSEELRYVCHNNAGYRKE